jgi:hypothetical protein
VPFRQPLENEVHLLKGVNEDDVEPTSSVDEVLREQGTLNNRLDDEWVGPGIWDVNPMVCPGERDRLLRPSQGLRCLGVDDLDLTLVLAIPPLAPASLQAANDHVDQPLLMLEGAIGVACLWWKRLITLVAAVLWL